MTDNMITLRQAGVDLSGLMSVLSRHLYSTPTVAVRELVQNAHDSIVRRRIEQPDWQGLGRIELIADRKNNTLRIIDNGAGLTEPEIHKYLATVGVGYTRQLRQQGSDKSVNKNLDNDINDSLADHSDIVVDDQTGLIGMFGLGFLSAFVLANRVSVSTTSYQQADSGHRYVSTNAENYSVAPIDARPIGTEVLLELCAEHHKLLQPAYLHKVLAHYCALLAEPIYVHDADYNGDKLSEHNPDETALAVNPEPPPWRAKESLELLHPVKRRAQALAFAARFEKNFEPICTIAVEPNPSMDSDAQGLLWIQDGASYATSDNRNLSVFLRGMLLDDDARDLLPNWAGFIGGVIESQQLTPTASREDLQRDRQFDHTRHALSEALINGLSKIATEQPEVWRRVLRRHNEALLGAALCDDRLFILLIDSLHVPTSQGDMLVKQLLSKGTIHVILDNSAGFEDMLFRTLGIAVAQGNRYAVVPFLRRWADFKGARVIELGTTSGNRQLFQPRALPTETHHWLQAQLCHDEKLIPARFEPASLPLIVVIDKEQALKKRLAEDDKDKKISQAALRLARQFTAQIEDDLPAKLYLNTDNPAVQDIVKALEMGVDNETILPAIALLKAFKTVLMSGASEHSNHRLQEALADISASIQMLLPASSV